MKALASAIQPFVDGNYIAGAVMLAATKDRVLACEAVGYADLAAKKPMTVDAMFWVASQTKPMTATALMMLVDEGKVSVDDPVEKYLPEFKGQKVVAYTDDDVSVLKKPGHAILVREVLNHTAGLAFASPIESPTLDRHTLRDSVRSHAMLPLQFEPGTKFMYSNAGTNTAGRIIEVVTGVAYEDFMDERLFRPLGMKDTTFWPNDEQVARLAKVYRTDDAKTGIEETKISQLSTPFQNRYRKPMPAGGLFSTAIDCARFCQMILGGGEFEGRRYLSEESVRQMTSRQTAETIEKGYGFCWDTYDGRFSHGGACKTDMQVTPALGLVTVYLIQHANEWRDDEGHKALPAFRSAAEKLLG